MRMFAGPNGSGKSVLKSYLPASLLGTYLNPDEIEADIRRDGHLDLRSFGVGAVAAEVLAAFTGSDFLRAAGLSDAAKRLRGVEGRVVFGDVEANSYFASVAADFLRRRLLARGVSFAFETVMSHRDKVELLAEARRAGYRTYLYYVATSDPEINVSRVRNRVALGGHAVPAQKIVERYHRSLALLWEAIRHSSRAYVFDNSTDSSEPKHTWLAEITDGRTLDLKTERVPAWFRRAVLDSAVQS